MEAGGLGVEASMKYPSGGPRGESTPETWQPRAHPGWRFSQGIIQVPLNFWDFCPSLQD